MFRSLGRNSILRRISTKGIKLSLLAKKEKFLLRLRRVGVKSKVGYKKLDIPSRVSSAAVFSRDFWKILNSEIKTVLFKPVRQVSHFGLVLIIMIVLATGIPVPKVNGEKTVSPVDPFGLTGTIEGNSNAGDKVTSVEAVATTISIIDTSRDEKMIKEAYEVADAQAAKVSLAVSGNSIAKASLLTTTSSAANKAGFEKYVVQGGDTLSGIARKFGVTTDSIKWSNNMSDADFVKPGQELQIPTITGIIYTVKSGDSIEGIASRYKSSVASIESQNDLYGETIKVGMKIIVPDGRIEEAPAAPAPRTQVASGSRTAPTVIAASAGPNRFPWGYCTWWVAHKRYIPWRGNAWQWYSNAIAYGRPVGKTPVAGAVMVTWESPIGHVAYVESVNGNTFTVSEMNYVGWGRVSTRTITVGQVPLIGFVY